MGANIGTSVTNTIVAVTQLGDRRQFRRAFAGATVHDMFNILCVCILLPVEVVTGYLYRFTGFLIQEMHFESDKNAKKEFLKKLTKPFTNVVIQIDKKVIEGIAKGDESYKHKSLIKFLCDKGQEQNVTVNDTSLGWKIVKANEKAILGIWKKSSEVLSPQTVWFQTQKWLQGQENPDHMFYPTERSWNKYLDILVVTIPT